MKNQKGFAVLEGLLILVIVGILAGTGWYVLRAQNTSNKLYNSASNNVQNLKATPEKLTETYSNKDYGFSFSYPKNWTLKTDLKDLGRGAPEGEIYVQSPQGTKVHFDPNFGGKGGDCADSQANDEHTTRTCTTRVITSVDKLPSSGVKDIWLLKGSDTEPTDAGGKTAYFIYLSSGYYDYKLDKYTEPKTGSSLGLFLGSWDDVSLNNGALNVFIEGKDSNASSSFLTSRTATESLPILNSFKVL